MCHNPKLKASATSSGLGRTRKGSCGSAQFRSATLGLGGARPGLCVSNSGRHAARGGGRRLSLRAGAERGGRLLHDGAEHPHADAVAPGGHFLRQNGAASTRRQGPLLPGQGRRPVPLRAGLSTRRDARASRELQGAPQASP